MTNQNPALLQLNQRAFDLFTAMSVNAKALKIDSLTIDQTEILDCGVNTFGGLEAGLLMSLICMSDLAEIKIVPARPEFEVGSAIQVTTDQPLAACLASQYAGWKLAHEKFFAMGSGPMRLAAAKEELFAKMGWAKESAEYVVGVLESSAIPPTSIIDKIATDCGVENGNVRLLVAPTASLAGGVQIVARSVETSLHKLHEVGFDVNTIISGYGVAPLPPPAKHDMAAIGRTNDAILYGGEVSLYVRCDDDMITQFGAETPSSASSDFGEPFESIFKRYDYDFYKIDPHLFSPAKVTFHNLKSGKTFSYGNITPEIVKKSFGV
jgi:methenyltetrahydromethanopterin cyclohydrolase